MSNQATMTPSKRAAWVAAARLRTLPAAAAPVTVGAACAYRMNAFDWYPIVLALIGALAIQIATNFANDVFDAEKGADGPNRLGPPRAVSSGWISARAMKLAMIAAFAVATTAGAALALHAGWPVIAIGVASILSGIAYTGGPYPLGYNGLGDIFVLIFFGPVAVLGTIWVSAGTFDATGVVASIAVGLLATAILIVNNLRDRNNDAQVGKRTLAVRFGRRFAIIEYAATLALAFACVIGVAIIVESAIPLAALVLAPLAVRLTRRLIAATSGPEFNRLLAATAQLLLFFGVALATTLIIIR